MKQIFFTLCACCLFFSLFAQPVVSGKELNNYVFPAFTEGTVKQKSGEVNKALLNYNSLTEEMLFEQSGQKMALDKTETIDTVYIENKKFIPAGKVFYEVATSTPVALFIQYKSDIIPPGNETGFGTSQTSAITNVKDLKNSGIAYNLKLPDDYKVISKKIYWLKKNNNYYAVKTAKNIQDLFPGKADAIKDYVKANKIDLQKDEDVIKLIRFCN